MNTLLNHLSRNLSRNAVSWTTTAFGLLILATLSALPAEAIEQTVCVRTRVTTVDSAIGEDFYAIAGSTTHPARYAKMRVSRNGFLLLPETYANSAGCVTFNWPATNNIRVEMWGEARIPRTDNSGQFNTLEVLHPNDTQAYWSWTFSPASTTALIYTNQSRRTNLLAISSWILRRWTDGLVGKTFKVYDQACPDIPDNSCNDVDGKIHINPSSNNRKFLIGHELGHAIVNRWINYHPAALYTINSGGPNCTTPAGMHHALHSKEYQSAALTEGFAQFYSTAVWNFDTQTTGWFHYYKTNYKNGAITTVNVESSNLNNPIRYLETQCTGSDDGRGVELDWMRAFWDYRTNPGTAPTHYQILRQIKNAVIGGQWGHSGAYDAFAQSVEDYDIQHGTDFDLRWQIAASGNGVDH